MKCCLQPNLQSGASCSCLLSSSVSLACPPILKTSKVPNNGAGEVIPGGAMADLVGMVDMVDLVDSGVGLAVDAVVDVGNLQCASSGFLF